MVFSARGQCWLVIVNTDIEFVAGYAKLKIEVHVVVNKW